MNIKVIEYTYPIIVLSVIYLICDSRDLRHTNNLQDVALDELTKSLPLSIRTNIDSYHDNKNSNKIESESGNLNHESIHKNDDDLHQATMNGDIVHHDETKRENSMSMNDSVSTTVSHKNYDKNRYGHDVSMIPTYDYRKSFDAAHRIYNNNKKTNKEIWPKQNLFPNNSHKAIDQKLTGGDSRKKLKQKQEQGLQERNDQLNRNIKRRKMNNDNVSTTIQRLEKNLKSGKSSQKKSSEGIEKRHVVKKRRVESYMSEKTTLSKTSCVLTKAEIIPLCNNEYEDCSKWALDGYCTNSTFMSNEDGTYKDWMIKNCPKTCDACPFPVSLLDSQIQYDDDNNATTFNLSLDVTTDRYAYETSWTFLSQNSEDSIFDSSEVNITSELENNAEYKLNYYCTVPSTEENQQTDNEISTCYNFEVHDSFGDGAGFFSLSLNSMNNKTLDVSNEFYYGSVMSTSFCLDHDDGEIESEGKFIIDGEEEELNETNDANPYLTSCTVTKASIISCDDDSSSCGFRASIGDCSKPDEKDWMGENCPKTCNTCPTLPSLENQIQHEEDEIIVTTFNVLLNVNTDGYARDTSWVLFPKDGENSTIFNSSDSIATSQLVNNERHVIQYNCIVSQKQEHDDQLNDKTALSTCYNFEVHDSYGDGICCKYGDGFFSMNVTTESKALQILDDFESFSVIKTSFCIGHDSGEIENKGTYIKKEPSHYPFRRWQCRNELCLCDSKPSLTNNIHEDHIFLLEVTMLSGPDKLQDLESAQYKAACWVLYDDPYAYDLVDEGAHNRRMIQRYILAVFYFATSPEKWEQHFDFLSSISECDWNYIVDHYGDYRTYGSSCDEDDNVISIDLTVNNLDGMIVDELSGLKMLEYLNLHSNSIRGIIPSMLGRLSELRVLSLGGNNFEGTIPPQLFNATNLEKLYIYDNRLEGTIPETIENLQKLSSLNFGGNKLSGSIPDVVYSLKNLHSLFLENNKLLSSISLHIGNLNKLEELYLFNNMLTGQIPSTIGTLSSLKELWLNNNILSGPIPYTMGNMTSLDWLWLDNNMLSGPIPESLFDLNSIDIFRIHNNSVTGIIPDVFCNNTNVEADCQNDVFEPEVSCSCCTCTDESPTPIWDLDWDWDGECAEATMKIVIDRSPLEFNQYSYTSGGLEWSITNTGTQKKIPLYPLSPEDGDLGGMACVAYSDCISIDMISPPIVNTVYRIYLNNVLVDNNIRMFPGSLQGSTLRYENDPFQFDEENQNFTSCFNIDYIDYKCYDKEILTLEANTTNLSIYDEVIKISGREIIQDTSSPQSKALCWMLQNNPYGSKTDVSDTKIIQRYILAILHVMSPYKLFGNDEYPPNTHECDWNGIACEDNGKNIVTGISLSYQIINGTLIDEIGSLKYLKVLDLNHTQLHGTIPRLFSNLWSLTRLDLSGNKISSIMPATLFRQLNKLEYINLSHNKLSGSINDDIGSFSHIRSLYLGRNLLTGSLPLDKFKHHDLEHLDISENELSGMDLSLLVKHNNLKTLDVSRNFFAGSLLDHTFTSLAELEYFNISQNAFSGTIPSTFPELSNITHFDAHANRFRGPIPLGLTEIHSIKHLDLQGNQLTGSLPSQLNKLKSLNALILSHNEFKGLIPFDPTILQNIQKLHLHSNKLSGKAPEFNNLTSYISDCGFPSDSLDPVSCSSCNTCCNSDGVCQSKTSENISQVQLTVIFVVTIVVLISMCYVMKDCITSNKYLKSFFSETVFFWNAMVLISDRSVYHFLLAKNKTEWIVAVCCVVFQTATLFLFVHSADIANSISDREYTMTCPANSLECEDSNSVSSYGLFVFALILTIWLMKDIVGSIKLMLVSFQKRSIDFFFASAVIFTVTMLSIWTSVIYIIAIAIKNTDMIKDAVVLLFVVEIDERIFQLVESINPDWIEAIDNNMRSDMVYGGDDLVITSWAQRSAKSMESMRQKIRERRESFRKRSSRQSGERKLDKEKEEVGGLHGENDVAVGDSCL